MELNRKQKLIKRLTWYWQMEAWNIVVMPLVLVFVVKGQISGWTLATFVPVMLLLGIGASYWRIKLHQLHGKADRYEPTMAIIRRLQIPSLILTIIAVGFCVLLWLRPELSEGRPDRAAITFMAGLAVLEYVNYYHRQLNYFDNKADLQRVFSGKGFRPSQMRRDLEQLARQHSR